jgi:ABC-type glycerol-3-phosphate transport system substrate-binding protein
MRRYCFSILILLLLPGCGVFKNHRVTICTYIPAILAYSETFNASQDKYRIEMLYHPEPHMMLGEKETSPDIIIGEYLTYPSHIQKFASLDNVLKDKLVDPDVFYQDILIPGRYESKQRLLPLCFNLPAILFQKNTDVQDNPDVYFYLDTLKAKSQEFIRNKGSRLLRMGFSPFWNDDFLYFTAVLYNVNFRTENKELLVWDSDALTKAIAFLKNWVSEIPGGFTAERIYSRKYLNAPFYQLIREKKIQFYFLGSKDIYRIPREKHIYFDFKWLSHENKIPVYDDIVFLGVPSRAVNKEGAKAFIRWIFNPETQGKLMEINHFKRLDGVFGIAGGFSSLKEVNNTILPQHYPLFIDHIPTSDSFIFPGAKPDNWRQIKRETILPWISEAIITENFNKKLEDQLKYFQE